MRQSNWAPSISPDGTDQTVYLVVDDFGRTAAPGARRTSRTPTKRRGSPTCQYNRPVRVVAFNTVERWARDYPTTSSARSGVDAICDG